MIKEITVILLMTLSPLYAADKYLRADASGNGSGSDWTNAYTSLSALENGLKRGDTGYVADGSYSGATFDTPVSGSTKITIRKAVAQNHGTSTGWQDSYGDGVAQFNGKFTFATAYWVVDGVVGGGPDSWTSGHGFKIVQSNPSVGACIRINASPVNVHHAELVGTGPVNKQGEHNDGICTYFGSGSGCVFSYNYIHDVGRCPFFIISQNPTVEYNYTGKFGGTPDGSHCEIVSTNNGAANKVNNGVWRYNLHAWFASTGGVMVNGDGWQIYGNVFDNGNAGFGGANGMIAGWSWGSFSNSKIYNNVFMRCANGIGSYVGSTQIVNNLFYDINQNNFGASGRNNHFVSLRGSSVPWGSNSSTASGDPFVDAGARNYRLKVNTPTGENLGSAWNKDWYGAQRTTWSRGAVEFGGAAPSPTPGPSPTATPAPSPSPEPTPEPPVPPSGTSLFTPESKPASGLQSDKPVQLGVKFASSVKGKVVGIRFYKAVGNSGTHVGSLWKGDGTKLGSVTFSDETASGWQQVDFPDPIAVEANVDYVAAYHAPVGYNGDEEYFSRNEVESPPLSASRQNGFFNYGDADGFPNEQFKSTNYWVDVVFAEEENPEPTPTPTPAPSPTPPDVTPHTHTYDEIVGPKP